MVVKQDLSRRETPVLVREIIQKFFLMLFCGNLDQLFLYFNDYEYEIFWMKVISSINLLNIARFDTHFQQDFY